jgi:hypothetical protein
VNKNEKPWYGPESRPEGLLLPLVQTISLLLTGWAVVWFFSTMDEETDESEAHHWFREPRSNRM